MPIYEYIASGAPGCATCRDGFDRLQRLDDENLVACPDCGADVHRVISAVQMVTGHAHTLQEKNVAKNGFTQYRRIGKGQYEKTAGKGPSTISGD